MKLVAPLIEPFDRKGYCIAYLDSRPLNGKRQVMRDSIKIFFDTRIKNGDQSMEVPSNVKPCKTDEDPFNDCKPVDCDIFYNGRRSHFSREARRCVEIPPCIADRHTDIPNVIYDPVNNRCKNEAPITKDDINFVKSLVHSRPNERRPKDIVIIKNYQDSLNGPNITAIKYVGDKVHAVQEPVLSKKNATECLKEIVVKYFNENKSTITFLGVIFLVQCCLLCTLIKFSSKSCFCCGKKKVIRSYFNYRQDASITTPLIGTSPNGTDTTDYQYLSESSNVEKKIKCYKACQKENSHNVQMSLSDDILSKCLNRRDWNSKQCKSEALREFKNKMLNDIPKEPSKHSISKAMFYQTYAVNAKKPSDTKVNFENETTQQKSKGSKKADSKSSGRTKKSERLELNDSEIVMSERELKCHSYNYMDDGSNVTSGKTSHESYNVTGFKHSQPGSQKIAYLQNESLKSPSIEKSAQACFSNDSIDDYLSERGMLYLAGENISKYSFSTDSKVKSSNSEASGKTSKNNILKNVLSLLKRKSKHGPMSDPGVKKSKDSIDLELIHMSHVSVYSSSNNDSECLKSLKRMKDSRTSL